MSAHTQAKATRLLAEGRVSPDDIREISFKVRGDSATYGVKLACDCPAAGSCSHLQAVLAWVTASPEEKAMMQEILRRKDAGQAPIGSGIRPLRAAPCPTTDSGLCLRDCHACYRWRGKAACAPCASHPDRILDRERTAGEGVFDAL